MPLGWQAGFILNQLLRDPVVFRALGRLVARQRRLVAARQARARHQARSVAGAAPLSAAPAWPAPAQGAGASAAARRATRAGRVAAGRPRLTTLPAPGATLEAPGRETLPPGGRRQKRTSNKQQAMNALEDEINWLAHELKILRQELARQVKLLRQDMDGASESLQRMQRLETAKILGDQVRDEGRKS